MTLALSENRYLRFAAFTGYYLAQGLPIGLLSIALPAWLAANGKTAAEVGTFVGITLCRGASNCWPGHSWIVSAICRWAAGGPG